MQRREVALRAAPQTARAGRAAADAEARGRTPQLRPANVVTPPVAPAQLRGMKKATGRRPAAALPAPWRWVGGAGVRPGQDDPERRSSRLGQHPMARWPIHKHCDKIVRCSSYAEKRKQGWRWEGIPGGGGVRSGVLRPEADEPAVGWLAEQRRAGGGWAAGSARRAEFSSAWTWKAIKPAGA